MKSAAGWLCAGTCLEILWKIEQFLWQKWGSHNLHPTIESTPLMNESVKKTAESCPRLGFIVSPAIISALLLNPFLEKLGPPDSESQEMGVYRYVYMCTYINIDVYVPSVKKNIVTHLSIRICIGTIGGIIWGCSKYNYTSSTRTSRGRKFPKGKELYSTERICL